MKGIDRCIIQAGTGRLIVLISLLVAGTGCMPDQSREPEESGIVTSFGALNGIVEPVAGSLSVSVLLPAGVSPHAYAPRPSDMAMLNRASLVVHAHSDIDGWMASLSSSRAVALFDSLTEPAKDVVSDDDHHGIHDHEGPDPHLWTDPVRVQEALPVLTDALCTVYPEQCATMRKRSAAFSSTLRALEDSLGQVAAQWQSGHEGTCFITAQPFMDRFLERFEFQFVGPLSPSADVEPSPASLSALISEASDRGCRILIVQDALENRLEKRLAAEQGWTLVTVDPVGGSASSYAAYLGRLMEALTDASKDSRLTTPPS